MPLVLTALSLAGSAILGSFASTTALMLLLAGSMAGQLANAQTTQSANAGDITPPVIELEAIDTGIAGQDQVFTALVADDGNLQDVKLYFRYMGQQAYQNVPMQQLAAGTDFYLATLMTEPDEIRTIEYYVQARDVAGNRAVEGFAFEPLLRTLTPAQSNAGSGNNQSSVATAEQNPQTESSSGGIKLWQIVLGVLALGAVAGAVASSGNDGGGGGTNNPAPQTVPLTITIGTP